ncbi:MAG: class I mannose-6-phosphate isomerase [Sphingomonadaceae bacterium]|nr:class I mannose-6-phosphate isomerase [Sphingomonadaceae bacterium]
MPAQQLTTRRVEKVWGRRDLGLGFGDVAEGGEPVGEIWFEGPPGVAPELLVKYLFTSEKLSVQVHPDDAAARAAGYPRGKDEAWVVLAAEPDATIGIGMVEPMDRDELRARALDGSIETKLDWKPVRRDDIFYSAAGTVHAIGPGVTLVEVQQNVDLTYRLYDYGRKRELHLDEGVAVSNPVPWVAPTRMRDAGGGRLILVEGLKFVLERWRGEHAGALSPEAGRPIWLVPLAGEGTIDGVALEAGTAWIVAERASLDFDGDLLVAYSGAESLRAPLG